MERVVLFALLLGLGGCGCNRSREPAPAPPPRAPTVADAPAAPEPAVESPAPTPPPPPGPRVATAQYTVEMKAPEAGYHKGRDGVLRVEVRALEGHTLHAEFPLRVELRAPGGMGIAKTRYERADMTASTPRSARVDVIVHPTQTGAANVDATVQFAVCLGDACEPREERLMIEVTATE